MQIPRLTSIIVMCVLLVLLASATVLSQSSANFDLSWNYIGSGTGLATSSSYRMEGTNGQPLADQNAAGSASFGLMRGYWVVGASTPVPTPVPTPTPTQEPLKLFLPFAEN